MVRKTGWKMGRKVLRKISRTLDSRHEPCSIWPASNTVFHTSEHPSRTRSRALLERPA